MTVHRSILCLLFLFLFVFSKVSSQSICTSKEIVDNDVRKCSCRDFTTPSSAAHCNEKCTVSGSCGLAPRGFSLANCSGDCTYSSNSDCNACGIWLSTLCECLQSPVHCTESSPGCWGDSRVKPANSQHPEPANEFKSRTPYLELWTEHCRPGYCTTGLAIDPARTVTQNQVHTHICPVNSNMQSALAKLSCQSYSSLNPVHLNGAFSMFATGTPNEMWCQVAKSKTSNIAGGDVDKAISSLS